MDDTFRFEEVRMLWLMAITVSVLILFLWWSWMKKKALISEFVKSRLLASLTLGVSWKKQNIRSALLTFAVILLFIALARPQWGVSMARGDSTRVGYCGGCGYIQKYAGV